MFSLGGAISGPEKCHGKPKTTKLDSHAVLTCLRNYITITNLNTPLNITNRSFKEMMSVLIELSTLFDIITPHYSV